MDTGDFNVFIHITPAGSLVELPSVKSIIKSFDDWLIASNLILSQNGAGFIGFCRERIPALDDLAIIYDAEEFVAVFEEWLEAQKFNEKEEER